MLFCEQCGHEVSESAKFCPACGSAQPCEGRMNSRVVLVTGSSGLVGASVVGGVAGRFKVRGIDRADGPATDIVGDIRDASVRRRALRGVWAVVHIAALHAPQVGVVDDSEFWEVNVDATEALIRDAVEAGVERFVYTSSTSVYGHALVPSEGKAVWVDEGLEAVPRDIYDETKLTAEGMAASSVIPTAVLRIARCFPEPPATAATHRLYRSVDVQDVATAHLLALDQAEVRGTFNVAGPVLFKPSDVYELWMDSQSLIRRRLPKVAEAFEKRGWPLPSQIDRVYDSGLAGRVLGYQPRAGVLDAERTGPTGQR